MRLLNSKTFIFILFTTIALSSCTSLTSGSTKFIKRINSTQEGYVKLPLDKDIYSNTLTTLSDFRIISNEKTEVPYFIFSTEIDKSLPQTEATILGKKSTDKGLEINIALYELKEPINTITIETTSTDYMVLPEVKNSDDNNLWINLSTSGYLYSIPTKLSKPVSTFSISDIKFRYVKILLKPISGSIKPDSIQKITYCRTPQEEQPNKSNSKIISNLMEGKTNTLIIDNAFSHAPSNILSLNISTETYTKQASIFGSEDQNSWQQIIQQEDIFKFKVAKTEIFHNKIDLGRTHFRYLKVILASKDSSEIKIDNIETFYYPEFVVFNYVLGQNYSAIFGNPLISTPPTYNNQKLRDILDFKALPNAVWHSPLIEQNFKIK